MAVAPELLVRGDLTLADYEALPDDGTDYEIIEGVLYVAPHASYDHQRLLQWLVVQLTLDVERRGLGRLVLDADLIVDERRTYVSPDLMIFAPERPPVLDERGWNRVAPRVAVEILSDSTRERDLGAKRQLYARIGVEHYWVVAPGVQVVTEHVLEPDGVYREHVWGPGPGGVFRPAAFAELAIDLRELFGRD
jgi:Uma2 family endonuclease